MNDDLLAGGSRDPGTAVTRIEAVKPDKSVKTSGLSFEKHTR